MCALAKIHHHTILAVHCRFHFATIIDILTRYLPLICKFNQSGGFNYLNVRIADVKISDFCFNPIYTSNSGF